ncbi:sulfite exporter TauE/SafE family protein [Thermosulfurimonas dismutans]|uniref:Probable membrane transporter protein n=1 Tax=Thermosulfurimonas dismutans TaxID=999894 RepID=A0A179D2Z2_9BACT|nr:sulfite exporter TauE/SafE family protein [Thermosulfurimonas dismutans]OAQ20435.1 hypothetical protein TDIS_1479 [Thermosulfurimonas dismutans]
MLEALILFFSAFVHGLAGFAFALLAVPLLSLIRPLSEIVPVIALWGFTMNLILFWLMRRSFRLKPVLGLLLGAIPGIFLGAEALSLFPEKILRFVLFFTVSGYCLWECFPRFRKIQLSPLWGPVFGFMAGFLGGMLNTPGPPVVIYVNLLRVGKDELKSALQGVFMVMVGFMILAHGLYGRLGDSTLKAYLLYLPAVLFGMALGQGLYRRIGEVSYHRVIHLFLFLSALAALLRAF